MNDVRRPEWLTADLFPFRSRFVELDRHLVHYVDEGAGPTLLMLHGNPTWSFVYRHLIARLRDHFRCVALDYPGFGLSLAAPGYDHRPASHLAVVELFVDRLGLTDLTPVVQDWGGPIGLGLAGRRPAHVRALVIGNTWAWPVAADPHFVRFSQLMGGPIGRFAIRHFNAFVNVMIPLGLRRRRLSSPEMSAYRLPLSTPVRRDATNVLPREIVGSTPWLGEVEAGLAALRDKPTLLCWGGRDVAFREAERRRFEVLFPRVRTLALPDAAHFVQEEAPDEIADAIRALFAAEAA